VLRSCAEVVEDLVIVDHGIAWGSVRSPESMNDVGSGSRISGTTPFSWVEPPLTRKYSWIVTS